VERALRTCLVLTLAAALIPAVVIATEKPVDEHVIHILALDGSGPLAGITVLATTEESTAKGVTAADGSLILAVEGRVVNFDIDTAGGMQAKMVIPEGLTDLTALLEIGPAGARVWSPEVETLSGDMTAPGPDAPDPGIMQAAPDSYEPDDTLSDCGSIPTDGTSQDRSIDPAGDEDWVCFLLDCGDEVIVETHAGSTTPDADTFLELYDPANVMVASDDDGGIGLFSRIEYTATEAGEFAAKVRGYSTSTTGNYSLTVNAAPGVTPLILEVTSTPVGADIDYHVEALTWAPREYTMTTGTEAIIDISGTGTPLGMGDDDSDTVSIPFTFEFYGSNKNSITIGSNGYATFGTSGTDLGNDCIPDTSTPNDIIAAFWDDLNPSNGGEVYYETQGTAPDRMFLIEWYQVPAYSNSGSHTFEIILYETLNEVELRYGPLFGDTHSNGDEATAGIENADGTVGIELSCDTPDILVEGTSARFALEPPTTMPYPLVQLYNMDQDTMALEDISSMGTALGLGDDDDALVTLPFTFKFYGDYKTEIRIGSNGYVTFGTYGTDLGNDCIPDTNNPNDIIPVFWDDLNPSNGGEVYHYTDGTSPDRRFFVQWHQVPAYSNSGSHTFQVILHETTNDIELRYGVLTGDTHSNGDEATAGIENSDGTQGIQASCDTAGNLVEDNRYTFWATETEPEYQWWDPVGGTIFDTDQDYYWTQADGCDLEIQVTVVDPGSGCDVVESEELDPCGGGGVGPCDTLAECLAMCEAAAANHGGYVSCVARNSQRLYKDGVITKEERQGARRDAAHSDIGK